RVDEREIRGGRLAQRGDGRGEAAGRRGAGGGGARTGSRARRGRRPRRAEGGGATRIPAETAAGEAQPPVDAVLEERRADQAVGGQAALRVPDQPEGLDVLLAELLADRADDVIQVLLVRLL